MIGHLSGTVFETDRSHTIVDVQGVGYLVYATDHTLASCVSGHAVSLYIHTIVREHALDLYGFGSADEKRLFELLITISGIGPKVGLGILNATTVPNLVQAVQSQDSSVLTKVSGIGKKNAEKIILELQNKLPDNITTDTEPTTTDDLEIFEALEALGYKPRLIQESLQHPDIKNLEQKEKMRAIMRHLS